MIALANAPVSYGVFELGAHEGARLPGPEDIAEMVAAAGYAGVDSGPVGMFGRGEELRSRLRRHGLSLAGGWVDLPFADDAAFGDAVASYKQALEFFAEAAAINADMPPKPTLACSGSAERKANPGGGPGLGLTSAQWDHYAANVQRAAEIASAYGLEPTFHHHACTYVETPAEIDELLARTSVDAWCLMSMCSRNGVRVPQLFCSRNLVPQGEGFVLGGDDEGLLDPVDVAGQVRWVGLGVEHL